MTTSATPSTPASAPRAGAGGGAMRADLAALRAEYARLWAAIHAAAARGDDEGEARLRNRAQTALGLLELRRRRDAIPPAGDGEA